MPTKRNLLNSQEAAEYLGFSISYFRKIRIPHKRPYLITERDRLDGEAARYLANNKNHL